MPYYIYIVTSNETSNSKSAKHVTQYDSFREAKTEVRRLRTEQPLDDSSIYRIMFADDEASAEKNLTEYREEPIAREWEK